MKHCFRALAASLLLLTGVAQSQDIALGGLDNFNDQLPGGWRHGGPSPNQPTVVDDGNGDFYLQNVSQPLSARAPGENHIILNSEARWTGDYIAAGVNKVRVNIANLTNLLPVPQTLFVRVGFVRDDLDCWVSSDPVVIEPNDGSFSNYEFLIDESTMSRVFGPANEDFEDALRGVQQIRFFSAAEVQCGGDPIFAVSGWDDFQTTADTDLDGVNNDDDNCTLVPNPPVCIGNPEITDPIGCAKGGFIFGQIDSDGDLYGNACDGDFSDGPFSGGDCTIDLNDLSIFRGAFLKSEGDPGYLQVTDMAYNGTTDLQDLARLRSVFLREPGPGLGSCGCMPPESTLPPGADFEDRQMFVRGGLFNNWAAVDTVNNAANVGEGDYVARLRINAGNYFYKIASEDWSVAYANLDEDVVIVAPGDPLPPAVRFPTQSGSGTDAFIEVAETGCYEFQFTAIPFEGDPPIEPPPPSLTEFVDVTVIGPLP